MPSTIDETVRFIDPCNRCGMILREFKDQGVKQPLQHWFPEVHELPDCIRFLNKRLSDLEGR